MRFIVPLTGLYRNRENAAERYSSGPKTQWSPRQRRADGSSELAGDGGALIRLIAGVGAVLFVIASHRDANACERLGFLGRVKSVSVTEQRTDPITGKTIGERHLIMQVSVSRDGEVVETIFEPLNPAAERTTATSHYEDGRLIREIQRRGGKTVSTTTCAYDSQGRVREAKTDADSWERNASQSFEYTAGSIRRRARIFGQWRITTQTLDEFNRVVKEVVLDEATATVDQTTEFTYNDNRQEQCWVSLDDPRRRCSTTVRDAHGNEIEFRADGESRTTSLEYDAVGNWISKQISATVAGRTSRTIVRREFEYW